MPRWSPSRRHGVYSACSLWTRTSMPIVCRAGKRCRWSRAPGFESSRSGTDRSCFLIPRAVPLLMRDVADFAIVGGGIVGLATGLALSQRYPGAALLLLEKEESWACHQTGRNSGVIHSGIYYKPGSLKATLAVEGNRRMVQFCR